MDDVFIYEWHELTRGRRLTAKLILQALLLGIVAGFGPELVLMASGHVSQVSLFQIRFMMVAVPVVILVSVLSYWKSPVMDVTTSSLLVDGDVVQVKRHVISETGRRFFVTWDSLEVYAWRVDETHRVVQVDAKWKASANRMKGTKPGKFVDADIRSHPQTFKLSPEEFYRLLAYLEDHSMDILHRMESEEYEKARPFIHKHHEI